MLFVLVMTLWAMVENLLGFILRKNILLSSISVLVIILTVWLLSGGLISVIKKRKINE
jgi:hypothetical protein